MTGPRDDTPVADGASGTVARRRLFARLDGAARVTQVVAPAGGGKTVLLRSWALDGLDDRIAQVRVTGPDPEPFWSAVLRALRAAGAPVREASAADGWAVVDGLLADLGALTGPLWLVIDDAHALGSGDTLRQLESLVIAAPPDLRFVFASREELRLGLHRMRLEGELTDIRAADLRFTLDEAGALLQKAGIVLSEQGLATVHDRTEGWAAGLRLAAYSLAASGDPEGAVAGFSGIERTVAGYLRAEVLGGLSERASELLVRTSMLDRVCGPLADLLTGDVGGERILQELAECDVFVVPLDRQRTWFRYHRLLTDLLRLELRQNHPERLAELQRTAATWYAEHGYPIEAVRQAQDAQDWKLSARVLSDHFLELILDGHAAAVHELLGRFPAGVLAADTELVLLQAAADSLRGSVEQGSGSVARAAQAQRVAALPEERRAGIQTCLAVMRMSLAQRRGDGPATAAEAERLLDSPEAALPGLRALALITLGAAELWDMGADAAERHLDEGAALAHRNGRPWLELFGLGYGAWATSFRSFAAAAEKAELAIQLASEHGWSEEPAAVAAYNLLAMIRVWQLRLDEAAALLQHAERGLHPAADPTSAVIFHQTRGMVELVNTRYAEALTAFHAADRNTGRLGNQEAAAPMRAHAIVATALLGDHDRAEADYLRASASVDRGELRNALAVLRLEQGDFHGASAALAPVLAGTAPVTNDSWLIQANLLEAIAMDGLGDQTLCGQALERALELAERAGTVFAFKVHPAPTLLRRHARRTAHAGLVYQLLNTVDDGLRREADPTEALTSTELRVLRFLPTNMSAPEIAEELLVSVNTVRTHMRHLYDKLDVHRRTEAVVRARTLGLLAPPGVGGPGTGRDGGRPEHFGVRPR
ncbi:LuxR C-terminal-related transcriptional regulator [Catenulispora rubra]|uniref:LuxR C-terminal-related transcriptional regulator n=1 Tax=Catenulispora rubra TaxID=280293 RepID=UPI0018923B28|nr:LuxR C-terminal-related transcriptional regulator [Catenulispora rubra]